MRYSSSHKTQTRERIVEQAARDFRARGLDGVGVAEIMKDAQLTHGGFYRHFASKEELYAESVAHSLDELGDLLLGLNANASRSERLRAVLAYYLSEEHCGTPGGGCPVAALASEIARQPDQVREAYQQALLNYQQRLQILMPGETEAARTAAFQQCFGAMAGALMVARSVVSPDMRRSILENMRSFLGTHFASAE
jgi:TetR/AcrR family transcriptional repressor of nem operon